MVQRAEKSGDELLLAPEERAAALALVRSSVEILVREGRRQNPSPATSLSLRRSAAFVTLTLKGRLRGCIGVLEPLGALDNTLVHCALAAASEDRRFPPVSIDELPDLRYEISILSPLSPARDPTDVEVGRHGVLLQARGREALLLPQVPMEHGWDRETYLDQVSRKAGLPQGAWRWPESRLWLFTAEVFGETPSTK